MGLGCPLILLVLVTFVLMRRRKRQNQEVARSMEYGGEASSVQPSSTQRQQDDCAYPDVEGAGQGQRYTLEKPELSWRLPDTTNMMDSPRLTRMVADSREIVGCAE